MSTIAYIVIAVVLFKIVKLGIESDRDAKVARIEADLKLKLAERVHDPETLRRIVETEMPSARRLAGDPSAERAEADRLVRQAEREFRPESQGGDERARASCKAPLSIFAGLCCFLVGVALVLCSQLVGPMQELVLPGAICVAVGLALLTFATSQRQILRVVGEDREARSAQG